MQDHWICRLDQWICLLSHGFVTMNNHIAKTYLNESNNLDGTNYANWKFKLYTFLEASSMWTIANKYEVKLTTVGGATATSIQDWKKRENKVRVLLKMSVKDNIIPHI